MGGGVVAGVAVLVLIHIMGSVVGEMVWWCWRRIDKRVIAVAALSWTGWGERRVIVVEAEEVRLLVRHGGAVRW